MRYRKLRIIVCTRKLPLVHIVSILIGQEIWGKIALLVYMSYGDCSFPSSFVYGVKTEQSIRCKDRGFCTPSLSCPTKCVQLRVMYTCYLWLFEPVFRMFGFGKPK